MKRKIMCLMLVLGYLLILSGCFDSGNSSNASIEGFDYVSFVNTITEEKMSGNVTIYNRSYNMNPFSGETGYSIIQGSGIIIKRESNKFYVLTNNHCTVTATSYSNIRYYVTDYLGEEKKAQLIYRNADYDLALLSFSMNEELTVLPISQSNALVGDVIASISQPEGQPNAVTLGKVVSYRTITLTDANAALSNVTFDVIESDAPTKSGSSGGAMLNKNFEITGVIYASSSDSEGNFVNSYAVPCEKVLEFLSSIEGFSL